MVGGIIPLRRAASFRFDERLEQESAGRLPTLWFITRNRPMMAAWLFVMLYKLHMVSMLLGVCVRIV
jgi:hypothetical protein